MEPLSLCYNSLLCSIEGNECSYVTNYIFRLIKSSLPLHFSTIDTVATVIMISLKINNKKWREELTDFSDLDTQLFVGTITRPVSHWCYNFEKALTT